MDFIGAHVGAIAYSYRLRCYFILKQVGEGEFRWVRIPQNQLHLFPPEILRDARRRARRLQEIRRRREYRLQEIRRLRQALKELPNLSGEQADRDRQDVEERTSDVPTQTRRSTRIARKKRRSSSDDAIQRRIREKTNAEAIARLRERMLN